LLAKLLSYIRRDIQIDALHYIRDMDMLEDMLGNLNGFSRIEFSAPLTPWLVAPSFGGS